MTFTVVARGPSRFAAPCDGPVQLVVNDSGQLSVYSAVSATGEASPCGPVSLAAGRQAVYSAVWPVDSTLPGGRYTATLVLGDTPALTLTIRVGGAKSSC